MGERGNGVGQVAEWKLPKELASPDPAPAAELLSMYFNTLHSDGTPKYSGAMFETFDGGGDAPPVADVFTAADLVAVTLLSVDVPGTAALRILGTSADDLTQLLERIPHDRELYEASDAEIGPKSAAEELWRDIRRAGVGTVTTSKLLARKRPNLLPVIDTVVKETLQHPRKGSFWLTLRAELNADGGRLRDHLLAVRKEAGLKASVSVIRCFDVVVWMIGKRDGIGSTRGRY
jgi:hypothetical protein